MSTLLTETEQKILDAAKKVFVAKGMAGARMQEIADEAGINKSLLHYYFRTKEKLFEAVFKSTLGEFFPRISSSMLSDATLEEKIRIFTREYARVLEAHPFLPSFILGEVSRSPDNIIRFFKENMSGIKSESMPAFLKSTQELVKNGSIREIDPRNLIINMIGMILFPVIAQPIIKEVLFDGNEAEFNTFMKNRVNHISEFVINSIKLP